ncbi:hypothetical protein C3L33_22741, partial [Rhododendron williamsianum]
MSITSKFLPLHLSIPNPNPKFPFPTPTPRPLSHPKPLTIRCAKKRQRTGNLRYPSEKKKLKSKQKTQIDEADKFEGFWRLYKLGVPVHTDPGKDFLGVSDALLEQIAKALKFPVEKAGATLLFEEPNKATNNLGIVVSPVRLTKLEEFGSPQFVADKLIQVEKRKVIDCFPPSLNHPL